MKVLPTPIEYINERGRLYQRAEMYIVVAKQLDDILEINNKHAYCDMRGIDEGELAVMLRQITDFAELLESGILNRLQSVQNLAPFRSLLTLLAASHYAPAGEALAQLKDD